MKIKRTLALALAVIMAGCMLFAACGEEKKYDITFKNELDETIDNLYYSPAAVGDWNDPVTTGDTRIRAGSSFGVDFEKLDGKDGELFDIGAITPSGMCYDLYDFALRTGDTIVLKGNKDGATFTITHADGTDETHEAHIYVDGEV